MAEGEYQFSYKSLKHLANNELDEAFEKI